MATKKTRFTAFRTNRGDTQHYTQQRSFLFFRFHLRYSDYRSVARKESWFQPINGITFIFLISHFTICNKSDYYIFIVFQYPHKKRKI